MPTTLGTEYVNEGPRARAWAARYVARGCHSVKAERLGWEKVWRTRRWPSAD